MRWDTPTDSKAIFQQLRAMPAGSSGVQAIIENHDACLHSHAALFHIDAATRAELACRAATGPQAQRILAQQRALSALVTVLPARLSSAV